MTLTFPSDNFTLVDPPLATALWHTELPKQIIGNMNILDEPNEYPLSYQISFDTTYTAFTTMQTVGGYPYDYDDYVFTVPNSSNISVDVNNITLSNLMVRIIDLAGAVVGTVHQSNGAASITFTQPLNAGNYFLEIYGTPTQTSYLNPHIFVIQKLPSIDIEDIQKEMGINIYPNPFTNSTTVNFSTEQINTNIVLLDASGKEIKSQSFSGKQLVIEKGLLKPGLYFLQTINNKQITFQKKIVIQ